jgi:hypothetical protein
MPEEMKEEQAENPTETAPEKEQADVKPTLDDIAKQNRELNDKLEKVLKQNSDKDSFISKLQTENKSLRGTVEKVSTSLEGKSEKQKDAILERHKQRFLEQGYDEKSVDLILETINDVSDRKAQEKIVPLIMEAAEDLVESDSEIDQTFLNKNQEAITDEYNSFRAEVSPRKIKANLKKAYKIVKERLAEAAKAEGKHDDREKMLAGGKPAPKGKEKASNDEDLITSIERAGSAGGHFV